MEATHLVAGGSGVPLKRTPKLLAGLGHCRFVVDVEWLYQSSKEGKLLDGVEFVLCDAEVCMYTGWRLFALFLSPLMYIPYMRAVLLSSLVSGLFIGSLARCWGWCGKRTELKVG